MLRKAAVLCTATRMQNFLLDEENNPDLVHYNEMIIESGKPIHLLSSDACAPFSAAAGSTLRQHLELYVSFCSSASNQDTLIKTLQWPLFSLGFIQLACQVSYARYVTRLFGLPAALDAVLHNSWNATSNNEVYNNVYKWLGKILAVSMVLYYPMEHAAFFFWIQSSTVNINDAAYREPVWWKDGNIWSYNSCRCWFIYVVADLTQCLIQLDELIKKQSQRREIDNKEGRNNTALLSSEGIDRLLQLIRNIAMLYPAMYWSMPHSDSSVHPFLSSHSSIYALMAVEALLHLYQTLRQY